MHQQPTTPTPTVLLEAPFTLADAAAEQAFRREWLRERLDADQLASRYSAAQVLDQLELGPTSPAPGRRSGWTTTASAPPSAAAGECDA